MQQRRELERLVRLSRLLLMASNLVVLLPIACAHHWSDALLLTLATTSASLVHPIREALYGAALPQTSERVQWWLSQADHAGAVLGILGLGSWALVRDNLFIVSSALALMLASQLVRRLGLEDELAIKLYTVLRCTWHVLAEGLIAYMAVTLYADEARLARLIH